MAHAVHMLAVCYSWVCRIVKAKTQCWHAWHKLAMKVVNVHMLGAMHLCIMQEERRAQLPKYAPRKLQQVSLQDVTSCSGSHLHDSQAYLHDCLLRKHAGADNAGCSYLLAADLLPVVVYQVLRQLDDVICTACVLYAQEGW